MDDHILSGPELSPQFYSECERTFNKYLLRLLRKCEDRLFMIDGTSNEQLLLSEFVEKSFNLAVQLQRLGCEPGDFIGIISENRLEYPIIVFAASLVGAVITCYDPQYGPSELRHTLSLSRPFMLFCSSQTFNAVTEIWFSSDLTYIILLDDDQKNRKFESVSTVLFFSNLVKKAKRRLKKVRISLNDTLVLLYTSGTTGFPKGVMLSHGNVVFMLHLIKEKNIWNFTGNHALGVLPMFNVYGFLTMFSAITLNHTLILMKKFEEKLYLSLIQKYKVEYLYLVPTLAVILLKSALTRQYNLTSVKNGLSGEAALQIAQETEFTKKININLLQMYGMTEACMVFTIKESNKKKAGTCGSLAPGIQAKVVHIESNETLGPGVIGELCFRSPAVMQGYLHSREDTKCTIRGGWLHSGDLGYYDLDGDFYVVDRLKELIKYKAYQVAPSELEALLLNHNGVKEVAVVGVLDDEAGELPKAFVVRQPGANVTEKALLKFVEKNVSSQKKLRGGLAFVDEIPKSPTGKILRRLLE